MNNQHNSSLSVRLKLAIDENNTEDVETIINQIEDIDNLNFYIDGTNPLHYAIEEDKIEIVKILLEYGADVNLKINDYTPCMSATFIGNLTILKLLVEYGGNCDLITTRGYSAFKLACNRGNKEIVKYLFSNSATHERNESLWIACRNNDVEIVALLLSDSWEKDKDIDSNFIKNNRSCLEISIQGGNIEIINILLQYGANINKCDTRGRSLLIKAIIYENIDIVELLLEKGIRVMLKDRRTNLPIHFAAEINNTELLNLIIQINDVNSKNVFGETPIFNACNYNCIDNLRLLIENGAEVNIQNQDGITPLMRATKYNNIECIRILLEEGAIQSIDLQDREGKTALHHSIKVKSYESVRLLVGARANLTIQNNKRRTPLDIAIIHLKNLKRKEELENPSENINNFNREMNIENITKIENIIHLLQQQTRQWSRPAPIEFMNERTLQQQSGRVILTQERVCVFCVLAVAIRIEALSSIISTPLEYQLDELSLPPELWNYIMTFINVNEFGGRLELENAERTSSSNGFEIVELPSNNENQNQNQNQNRQITSYINPMYNPNPKVGKMNNPRKMSRISRMNNPRKMSRKSRMNRMNNPSKMNNPTGKMNKPSKMSRISRMNNPRKMSRKSRMNRMNNPSKMNNPTGKMNKPSKMNNPTGKYKTQIKNLISKLLKSKKNPEKMIGITKKELDEVTELVNTLDMRKLNDNSRFNKILDKIQKNILKPKKKTKTKKTKTKSSK